MVLKVKLTRNLKSKILKKTPPPPFFFFCHIGTVHTIPSLTVIGIDRRVVALSSFFYAWEFFVGGEGGFFRNIVDLENEWC